MYRSQRTGVNLNLRFEQCVVLNLSKTLQHTEFLGKNITKHAVRLAKTQVNTKIMLIIIANFSAAILLRYYSIQITTTAHLAQCSR